MHLFFSSYSPVKPGLNGPEAASPPLPVVNCQTSVVDDGTTKDIKKHTCLISLNRFLNTTT